jgi:hypothetical protein
MHKLDKLLLIILFLLLLGGIAGWWYYQRNQSSKGDLILNLLGPNSASAGQEVEYTLRCRNQGSATIVQAELFFNFPEHSQPIEPSEASFRQEIESIYPGQEKVLTFRARLFGQVEEVETAQAKVSYRLKGLKAYYNSETQLATVIDNIPLTFEFDLSNSVPPQEEFEFLINYASYFDQPISNLVIKLETPPNFQFISSQPESIEEERWEIPTLLKREGGQIKVRGKMVKESGQSEIFRASLGVWTQEQFVKLKEIAQTVATAQTPVYLSQQINNRLDYVASPGDLLHYEIFFRNVSDYPLEKQLLLIKLDGSQFDLDTLRTTDGLYQEGDNSLLWDWKSNSALRFLDKREEGSVEFWVNLKKDWPVTSQSPEIYNVVEIGQIQRVFPLKVNSRLDLVQKAYHQDEFFNDKGPFPFQVGKTTTYTIFWQVSNFCNLVEEVKVETTLPDGAWFNNQTFPEDELDNLSYNSASDLLVWEVGQLEPEQQATLAFQLSFTPQGESDTEQPLIEEATVFGKDQWTEKIIEAVAPMVEKISQLEKDSGE